MRPDFHVNMTLEEWKEHQREEERKRREKQFVNFLISWGFPAFAILFGFVLYNLDRKASLVMIGIGVLWLVMSIASRRRKKPSQFKPHRRHRRRHHRRRR